MSAVLISLALLFTQLSVLAFGGGNTILPEMQREVVQVHHWMSAQEFSALFALAQAAPGPNMMIVPLVGWQVAGWAGLLVSSLAKFGPSSIITLIVMGGWKRYKDRPWRQIVQRGLVPVTVGLVVSSGLLIAKATAPNLSMAAVIAICTLMAVSKRFHPLWVLAVGAVLGLALG
ncbi:MAG: chromate transporter [Ewingella americana]|jgi:chromate transporter|uniref:Chromate transport protein n=2 Tax=Ewingella americana TaxID=41202 RepID=A0A085GHI8_EWIA3|nr:chromate transporter [Ewingella americana]KAA8729376.1 chromate transporter [Ewingella americana]KFC83183.1 chromate transport protein [Ewingella americana ATCC 33852]MCI1680335.1 chromate transporter [Ewingella americana]MCI1854486.1 chromate transporter [Ewingella americana]MCI1860739.1 chromate transporter [Ewingella americana]